MLPGAAHAADFADDNSDPQTQIVVTGQRPDDANPNADPDAPFKIDRSDNPRFTEKTRDTPKTQIIIPKEVIENTGATSFREVARATPGVTLGTGEGGNAFGDRIFIRGFEARNDIYIDGLRDPGVVSREVFAVEQIEIVKGPSSSFGGRGTTGGLVSLQSKRPLAKDFTVVSASAGTDNFLRGTADANYKLSDTVAVRVNGLYHTQAVPGRDQVFSDRYGAAAAVAFTPVDGLEILADYYFFRLDGMSDYGHPFDPAAGKPYAVHRDNLYGAIGRDFLSNGSDIATLRMTWDGAGTFQMRAMARYGVTTNRYVVSVPRAPRAVSSDPAQNAADLAAGFVPGQLVVDTGTPQRNAKNEYLAGLIDFSSQFATGSIGHKLVFGAEFASETITNLRYAFPALIENENGDRIATPGGFTRDLFAPNPVLGFTIPALVDATTAPTVNDVDSLSFFALDTIDLTPQLKATLGARYDTFTIDSSGDFRGAPFRRKADTDFWNWQASLLWKPSEPISLYASFATSSNPSGEQLDATSSTYGGLGTGEEALAPERNTSWELGAKWELGHVLLSAAAFRIDKTNAREQTAPGIFELSGEQRAQGVELGIAGNVTEQLALFGGYTWLDATVTQSIADPAAEGQRLANVPEQTAALLASYTFLPGFEVGAQVSYRSEVFGGSLIPNAGKLDSYVRFDAVARARLAPGLNLRINVLNLTDKVYYDAIYRSGSPFAYIAPGRSAYATLEATF
jgi:catecholate siderophore receptor